MNDVNIRFYAELNDFLPRRRRYKTIPAGSAYNRSVKDLIEALGIPHTEIDLILINGTPAPFTRRLQPGDFISVYPVFESLDIKSLALLRPEPLRTVRFVMDAHLGKLAKYLRMLGFDAVYDTDMTDDQIISMSVSERRVILTRDLGILKNRKVSHGYFVRSQDPTKQLEEVVSRFDLGEDIKPFKRCLLCNGLLLAADKEEITSKVPSGAARHYSDFFKCSSCGKIYWEGSHVEDMTRFLNRLRKIRRSGEPPS